MHFVAMKSRALLLVAAFALLGGCGRRNEIELAARSKLENVPNGPFVLGFWPGESRPFALAKAQAFTKMSLPADSATARVVDLPKLEIAELPCVVELIFHRDQLLNVYVGFLTRDEAEIHRIQKLLTDRYGPPTYDKPGAGTEFKQWVVKEPVRFTVVSGSGPGQLPYVSCFDAGSLFQSAFISMNDNREADARRVKDLARKNGF